MMRWSRRLLEAGTDPDPRFTFANERTFLAWIRTALALVAAGLGVDALALDLPDWGRKALAAFLVVLGGLVAVTAFRRWLRAELAMRTSESLPTNQLAPIIAYGLTIGAGLTLVLVLIEH